MTILLDTSAFSSLLRQQRLVDRLITESTNTFMSPIVVGELIHGYKKGSRYDENMKRLKGFLSEKEVSICDVDMEIASIYAELKLIQGLVGRVVAPNDLWIASTAIHLSARLVTFDSDFAMIDHPGLQVTVLSRPN